MLLIETKIQTLQSALPAWHFEKYSKDAGCQVIACFPPGGPSMERWVELETFSPIQGVYGPIYAVSAN